MNFLKLLYQMLNIFLIISMFEAYGIENIDATPPHGVKRKFCAIDCEERNGEDNLSQENKYVKKHKVGYQYQDISLVPVLSKKSDSVFNEIQSNTDLSYQEDWLSYQHILRTISYQNFHVCGLYKIIHYINKKLLGILYVIPSKDNISLGKTPYISLESAIEIFPQHQRKGYASKALKALTTTFLPSIESRVFCYKTNVSTFQGYIAGFYADIHWENFASLGVHLKNNYTVVRTTYDNYDLFYPALTPSGWLMLNKSSLPRALTIAFNEFTSSDKTMVAAASEYLKYYRNYQELEDSQSIEDTILEGDKDGFYQKLANVQSLIQSMNGTPFENFACNHFCSCVAALTPIIFNSVDDLMNSNEEEKDIDIEALNLLIIRLRNISHSLQNSTMSKNIAKLIEICNGL